MMSCWATFNFNRTSPDPLHFTPHQDSQDCDNTKTVLYAKYESRCEDHVPITALSLFSHLILEAHDGKSRSRLRNRNGVLNRLSMSVSTNRGTQLSTEVKDKIIWLCWSEVITFGKLWQTHLFSFNHTRLMSLATRCHIAWVYIGWLLSIADIFHFYRTTHRVQQTTTTR